MRPGLSHARLAPPLARARDRTRGAGRHAGSIRRERGAPGGHRRRDDAPLRAGEQCERSRARAGPARVVRRHRDARPVQSAADHRRAPDRRAPAVGRRPARRARPCSDRGRRGAPTGALPGRGHDPGRPHHRDRLGSRDAAARRRRCDAGAGAARRAPGHGADRHRSSDAAGGVGAHPPHRRRRVHRRPARARRRNQQHERTHDPAARRRRDGGRAARRLPPLPDQGGQRVPPARHPGRRRRAAHQRHPGERSGVPARLPRAAAQRAARRRRHRARRDGAHTGVRPPMSRLAAALLLCSLVAPARAASDATVALNFQDVDLPVLARFVSEVTGRNFILDERVKGPVTIISPTRITPEEAYLVFQSVLQVKGFTTVPSGKFVKIVPVSEGREGAVPEATGDQLVTRILPLRHADAAAAVPVVQPLVSKDGVLTAYPPTNRLVVVDTASNVERIAGVVRDLDVAPPTDRATESVPLHYAPADELAGRLRQALAAEGAEAAALRVVPETRTNSLVLAGPVAEVARARALATRLDVAIPGASQLHVYRLKYAQAETLVRELSQLLCLPPPPPEPPRERGSLIMRSSMREEAAIPPYGYDGGMGEPPPPPPRSRQPEAVSTGTGAAIPLEAPVRVTADPATNTLVI